MAKLALIVLAAVVATALAQEVRFVKGQHERSTFRNTKFCVMTVT